MQREKLQNQPYPPQYYGGYNQYQAPPPQRPMAPESRWNPYQQMTQPQPQHVYNPLNPMAPKFNNPMNPMVPNQPQMQPQMGQNPMSQGQMTQNPMGQGQMGQGNMMGMYKNPMMGQRSGQMNMGGHYYDPRYPGYQNPQWLLCLHFSIKININICYQWQVIIYSSIHPLSDSLE